MKIMRTWPPNIGEISAKFDITGLCVYFTYGDTIHNPSGADIPRDFIEHEKIHIEQQEKIGADIWWGRYLTDREFRIDQEAAAYGAQVAWWRKRKGGAIVQNKCDEFAQALSSKVYGHCIDYRDAYRLILRLSLLPLLDESA